MTYFNDLLQLLRIEWEEDRRQYSELLEKTSLNDRRAVGLAWYPVVIRDTEIGRGDYLTIEIERTSHQELDHQFRFGMPALLFSNHAPTEDRLEGVINFVGSQRLKLSVRVDELPDWTRDGKLGIQLLFDENSYQQMEQALKQASTQIETPQGHLIKILTGAKTPSFKEEFIINTPLNESQNKAIAKILTANELAIVHGPPGTGKTTTLVQAIQLMAKQESRAILVCAPSNTAVDLLSERLSLQGLSVIRIGNPVRVSPALMSLTLDAKIAEHPQSKLIKQLKKQASEFKGMAHKYKRNFGPQEREQRKLLFEEARKITQEIQKIEQFITDDLFDKAQVITATLVGANHFTVASKKYHVVVIDEAGQSLEPACWIPILKGQKLIVAGDHFQLPPTVKSVEAARKGLNYTLLEKAVALHPQAVTLLEEQYRMNEPIMGYSSKVFYENRLKAHQAVAQRVLFNQDHPLLYIDTAGCGFEEKQEDVRISNPEEGVLLIKHLVSLVKEIENRQVSFPSIGIISPYKQQVKVLEELANHIAELQPYRSFISINTVDSFQGQERDVVYISLTRSNARQEIGFLADTRRMNVAMTRARKKLVVIGDSATLGVHDFYKNFITYAENHSAYHSAWEFIE